MKRFSRTLNVILAVLLAVFSSGLTQLYAATPLSAAASDHIVVCHQTGSGYHLVPPSQTSAHADDTDDFTIESTFSPTQIWDTYKDEYSALCEAGPTVTTPTAPAFSDTCGTTDDTYTIPAHVGVAYYVDNATTAATAGVHAATGSITIVAKPLWGQVLTGTTQWTHDFLATPACNVPVLAVPAAPEVTSITACGMYGSITMATTPGVTYTLTVGDGKQGAYTVTATAQPNYYFAAGTQTTWSGTLGTYFACLAVKPCTTVAGPELINVDSEFATYQDTRTSGHYEFTADGLHIWTTDATSQAKVAWYHAVDYSLANIGSPTMDYTSTTGPAPGMQIVVDFDNDGSPDGILVGESVYGNNWWLSNSAKAFVKDAAPHRGGGYGSEWYGTLDEWLTYFPGAQVKAVGFSLGSGVLADGTLRSLTFGCLKWQLGLESVTPVAPAADDTCYTDNDWIRLTETTGVIYKINGTVASNEWQRVSGDVTVTAEAAPGYVIATGATSSWNFRFTDKQCLAITKVAQPLSDTNHDGVIGVGDVITWNITVTNNSTEVLDDEFMDDYFRVVVSDTGATLVDGDTIDTMSPGDSIVLHATTPITAVHMQACKAQNIASFIGWRSFNGKPQTVSVASGTSETAVVTLPCPTTGNVLGTSTTTPVSTPQVLPATIADTGSSSQSALTLVLGVMLSALTYFVVLRRQDA